MDARLPSRKCADVAAVNRVIQTLSGKNFPKVLFLLRGLRLLGQLNCARQKSSYLKPCAPLGHHPHPGRRLAMTSQMFGDNLSRFTTFGLRRVTPRACVADSKRHLRAFLTDVLEDLGFVTSECAKADELGAILETQLPDLVLLGVSVDGFEVSRFLKPSCTRSSLARFSPSAPANPSSSRRCGKLVGNAAWRCCRRSPRRSPRKPCASAWPCFCLRNQNPVRRSMCLRHCMPAGSNCGTSRRSMPAHSFAPVPRRW